MFRPLQDHHHGGYTQRCTNIDAALGGSPWHKPHSTSGWSLTEQPLWICCFCRRFQNRQDSEIKTGRGLYCCHVGFDKVSAGTWVPVFRRNIRPPPFGGQNEKMEVSVGGGCSCDNIGTDGITGLNQTTAIWVFISVKWSFDQVRNLRSNLRAPSKYHRWF